MKSLKWSIPDSEDRLNTIFAGLFLLLLFIALSMFAVLVPNTIPTLQTFIKASLVREGIYALFTTITVVKAIFCMIAQDLSPDELDNVTMYTTWTLGINIAIGVICTIMLNTIVTQ